MTDKNFLGGADGHLYFGNDDLIKSADEVCRPFFHGDVQYEEALLYDDGDPCVWTKRCQNCENWEHENALVNCPTMDNQADEVLVCEFCFVDCCVELIMFANPRALLASFQQNHPTSVEKGYEHGNLTTYQKAIVAHLSPYFVLCKKVEGE